MSDVVALASRAAAASTGDASGAAACDASLEEPCYGCKCCRSWAASLELLHQAVLAHNAATPRPYPCSDECLVCKVASWSR
jgi:hypothetical protein